MNRIIAAAVLLAFMPTANAADKKSEFSTDAEFRARYMLRQNIDGNENTIPANSSTFSQRTKLGLNYRASEKLSAHMTLLHNATWGHQPTSTTYTDSNTDTVSIPDQDTDNAVLVNEAFANWMVSDDLGLRMGRQNFEFGNGMIMGKNDWEARPNAFDGVSANYEMEAGTVKGWAFKMAELTGVNGVSGAGDPEHNSYGVSYDFKTMPEVLKMVNVHVIKDSRNTAPDTTAANGPLDNELGQDFTRYGASVGGLFSGVDFGVTYEKVTGDYLFQDTQGADVTKVDGGADMMHVSVGYGMEEMMKSHVSLSYHKDSGNDGSDATSEPTYRGYSHESHCSAGCMDLLDYGNLSFWALNAQMSPMENTTVKLGYYMFKATESGATASGPTAGANGGGLWTTTGANPLDVTKDDLGSEIDLIAEHTYDSGLSTMARVGYFMPGDALDNATTDKGDKVMQFFLQAKMTF